MSTVELQIRIDGDVVRKVELVGTWPDSKLTLDLFLCGLCGKVFIPDAFHQVFCSVKCRSKHHRNSNPQ